MSAEKEGRSGPEISLYRVVELLTGPNCSDLAQRHVVTIEQLCRTNASGFAICDLKQINQVLQITLTAVKHGHAAFEEPLCLLLRALSKPLVKKSSTDEMKLGSFITDMLTLVGKVLGPSIPAYVQACACEMLVEFATGYGKRPNLLHMEDALKHPENDPGPRRYQDNQRFIGESDVISSTVHAVASCTDVPLAAAYLNVLLQFSYLAENATQLLNNTPLLAILPSVLAACSVTLTSPLIPIAIDLLWNVLDHMDPPRTLPSPSIGAPHATASLMMATPPKTPKTQTSIASERAAGRTSTGSHARTGAEHASERARASKSASATSRANTPSGAGERTSGEGQPEGGDLGTQLSGRSWASRRSSAAQRDLQNSRSSQRLSMSLVRLMSRHSEISPEQLLNNARSGLEKIADHPSDYVAPEFANVVEDRRSDASLMSFITQPRESMERAVHEAQKAFEWEEAQRSGQAAAEERDEPLNSGSSNTASTDAAYAALFTSLLQVWHLHLSYCLASMDCALNGTADTNIRTVTERHLDILQGITMQVLPFLGRNTKTSTAVSTSDNADRWQEAYAKTFDDDSRGIRNSLIALLSFLLESKPFCTAACSAGLVRLLGDVIQKPDWVGDTASKIARQAVVADGLDHEHRRLLWSALAVACERSTECCSQLVTSNFMKILLLYVDLDTADSPALLRWKPAEATMLRRLALTTLFRLAPICPDEFQSCEGARVLLEFIRSSDEMAHVESALRVLQNMASRVTDMRPSLVENQGVAITCERFADRTLPQNLRQQAVMLMQAMCKDCPENLVAFEASEMIELLAKELHLQKSADPLLPNYMCMELASIVWTLIVGSPAGLNRFLQAEGMDMLIDHLEQGNEAHQPLILSILADMLKNAPLAHEYWQEWRSERDQATAYQVLLRLWRTAEVDKEITREGVLTSIHRPLEGSGKRALFLPKHEVQYGFLEEGRKLEIRSISNAVSDNRRMCKIYAILNLVGFKNATGLDAHDRATLTFVEKYVKFKQGEIWIDMNTYFKATGFRPTASDRERLQSGIEFSQHLANVLIKDQQTVLLGEVMEQTAKEKQYYADKTEQARRDYNAKFYKKDKSQLSAKEKQEARQAKEAMLAASAEKTRLALEEASIATRSAVLA